MKWRVKKEKYNIRTIKIIREENEGNFIAKFILGIIKDRNKKA
jgi:hypothetical protein